MESLGKPTRLAETLKHTSKDRSRSDEGSFDSAAYLGPSKLEDLTQLTKQVDEPDGDSDRSRNCLRRRRATSKATGARSSSSNRRDPKIFHRHAKSRQGSSSQGMVRLEYMAPRLHRNARDSATVSGRYRRKEKAQVSRRSSWIVASCVIALPS